jgi:hypothetical protein
VFLLANLAVPVENESVVQATPLSLDDPSHEPSAVEP